MGWPSDFADRAEPRFGSSERPARLVAASVFVVLGFSSIVMTEPAICDVLFVPVLALALLTVHMLSPRRLPGVILASMVVFILANYASVIPSRDWDYEHAWFYLAVTVYMLVYAAFFACFVGKYGDHAMNLVRNGYALAAVIAGLIGVLAVLGLVPNREMFFRDASMVRVQSTFKDPNVFAPFLVGAIFLTLVPLVHAERVKARHLVVVGLSLAGVALSFSRGAWAHLAFSLVLFVALEVLVIGDRRANRRLRAGFLLGLPIMVGGVVFLLLNTGLDSYLLDRLHLQSYDATRFGNQAQSLELVDRTLFGLGPGQYGPPRFTQDVHNVYIKVLVENGVIGLLSFGTLLFASVFYGMAGVFRRGPFAGEYAASVSVLVGIMVESMVIDTLHWRHLFLFIGLPIGLTLYERFRPAEPAPSFFLQSRDGAL